ncbi:hypothetical protein ACQXW1_17945, partial [Lactiplantibacillus pentosus]
MAERTYQIEHSEAKLLLTEQPFLEEHREGKPARAVDIEDVQNAAGPPVTEIESIHLDDAATIMYT